ncbi:NAD(P)H-binding protein [Thiorhodovibrio frisius]|uniref:Putative nucleoside-diphosphate sugar epimerase n=1 Tax=Thiorhodovibrio frisius TaxID=631362 RepID=H8Z4W2_9GAMM|nr:NAD(P)H-binding protein [Thiorhodovibrio frisius]EIC20369.1 putative nucleoside-diphosphate sugar epimerase [Thiorhodovibrio frisius]WPL21109.1 Putative NADH-flavin reductase [Thiorhodovibrio frisius]
MTTRTDTDVVGARAPGSTSAAAAVDGSGATSGSTSNKHSGIAPNASSDKNLSHSKLSGSGAFRLIAVAGASGFIGTALCPELAKRYQVRALTRSQVRAARPSAHPNIHWEHCDLFSADAVRHGLRDVDVAIYLVHSQAPSSRLTQAQPRDMDLILADNFAQAAAANGVRQILFVSGLLPRGFEFAPLLWNRREVEMVLAARGSPVTALRASLVVGPGGSGPSLLIDLVRRLPVMLLPPSAQSLTRPIALQDLIRALLHCLGRPQDFTGAFDIGGADGLSYAEMLRTTADALGLKRRFIPVPVLPKRLAALTARWVAGAPPALVGAIVESLPEDNHLRDNPVQQAIAPEALGFRAALEQVLTAQNPLARQPTHRPARQATHKPVDKPAHKPTRPISPRAVWLPADRARMRQQSLVRSIQRIITPPGLDAAWVAGNYFRWLGRCCFGLIKTELTPANPPNNPAAKLAVADRGIEHRSGHSSNQESRHWTVTTRWPRITLLRLELEPALSTSERRVYRIAGGLLARPNAPATEQALPRFEFQSLLDGRYTMAAIHDYAPALPWAIYRFTQAPLHLWVMRRYQHRLATLVSAR